MAGMKIALVSPYSDITSLGIRQLSSVLKPSGHEVHQVFIPHAPSEEGSPEPYSQSLLDQFKEIALECDMAGISLMTNYFFRALRLTEALRSSGREILTIWGGIHPTIRPEECLEHADLVCVGEGEEATLELAEALDSGSDFAGIQNIWLKKEGKVVRNPARPLLQNLNELPFPDYDLENCWIWDAEENVFQRGSWSLLQRSMSAGPISKILNKTAYQTIATRGCPHNCTYCCNNVLRELYDNQQYVRRRNTENILDELSSAIERMPFIKVIGFSDDSFFAASEKKIREFSSRYKEVIGLPFFCLGSPLTITEGKLEALTDAGLFGLQMGIQSGSRSIQKLYNRPISNERILKTARTINRFRDRMIPPTYDFIIDNPFESRSDVLETLALIRRLPKPRRIQLFSLVIFPETKLYRHAIEQGKVMDKFMTGYEKEYHKREAGYLNLLLGLHRYPVPGFLLAAASHPRIVALFDRKLFNRVYEALYKLAKRASRLFLKRTQIGR